MFFVIDSLFQYILLHKCIVTDKDNNLLFTQLYDNNLLFTQLSYNLHC